jgi:hypothetical protein
MSNGRYCVIIDEGGASRRMLVARFVALGDAVNYAMWRRNSLPDDKPWKFVVETVNAIRPLYEFAK